MRLQTETVPCNLCGSSNSRNVCTETYRLHDAEVSLGVVRCNECQLVYTSPRLTLESTLQVYEHDTEDTISSNYCWSGDHTETRFSPLLRRLHQFAPGGQLLDIGCGSGDFLRVAENTGGWGVTGIEPVPDAAEAARRTTTATIHACLLEQAPLEPQSYDVVSLLGVLEHLHAPSQTLATVRTLVKPGGLLAIYVPNFNYLRLKDLGLFCWLRRRRWSDLHPQEHQFQFTQSSLRALLENNGFEVLRTDVGRPFAVGDSLKQTLKSISFSAVELLWKLTGIHLGGLEVIARMPIENLDRCPSRSAA